MRFFTQKYSTQRLLDLKKFWEKIKVLDSETGRKILIDGKPMKTPNNNVLCIPYHKPPAVAELVAEEWRALPSLKLKSHLVPLTSLVGRSIDISDAEKHVVVDQLLPYLDTDTLCVISPKKDCEGKLRKDQLELYPPLLEEACREFNIKDLKILDTEKSMFGNFQSPETKTNVKDWMLSLDNFRFASLERATTASKSLVVGMNVSLNKRSVDELAKLVSLDVLHQTAFWGEVEDTHDVDKEDIRRLLGAAYVNAMEV